MITAATFEMIVMAFCSWKDPKITAEYRLKCTEQMYNCAMKGYSDGTATTNELVDQCREAWIRDSKNIQKYK